MNALSCWVNADGMNPRHTIKSSMQDKKLTLVNLYFVNKCTSYLHCLRHETINYRRRTVTDWENPSIIFNLGVDRHILDMWSNKWQPGRIEQETSSLIGNLKFHPMIRKPGHGICWAVCVEKRSSQFFMTPRIMFRQNLRRNSYFKTVKL